MTPVPSAQLVVMADWLWGYQRQWQGLGTTGSWAVDWLHSGQHSRAAMDPGQIGFMKANSSWAAPEQPAAAVRPGYPLLLGILQHLQPSLEPLPSHYSRAVTSIPDHMLINSQGRFKHSVKTSSGAARAPGMSSSYAELPNGMSLLVTI